MGKGHSKQARQARAKDELWNEPRNSLPIPPIDTKDYYIRVPSVSIELWGIPELLEMIFQNLDRASLAKCRGVCRLWYRVIMLSMTDKCPALCQDLEWLIPRPKPSSLPLELGSIRYHLNGTYRDIFEERWGPPRYEQNTAATGAGTRVKSSCYRKFSLMSDWQISKQTSGSFPHLDDL